MLKSKMYIFTPQETFQKKLQKISKDKTITSELNSQEISWTIWKNKEDFQLSKVFGSTQVESRWSKNWRSNEIKNNWLDYRSIN